MREVQELSLAPGQQVQQLIEGPRRSKLTFAASEESSTPIRLDRLRRVREPVSRSKSGVQGKVADVLGGRSRHAESQNELKAFQVLMATARSDGWQEQPLFLEYHHKGTKHRYTPDVLVAWGEHQEIVEIKDDAEADLPENQIRFALIRELLTEHGLCFRVWKKSEICAEPRMANVARILRYTTQEVGAVSPEPFKIGASTPHDFTGRNLTDYGGLLPVATMLDKLGFQRLVEETLTIQRLTRAMPVCQFVLAMVLALYVGFARLHHLRFLEREPMLSRNSAFLTFSWANFSFRKSRSRIPTSKCKVMVLHDRARRRARCETSPGNCFRLELVRCATIRLSPAVRGVHR